MNRSSVDPVIARHHCILMQRLTEAINEAVLIHPEYDLNSLIGRAEMETFIASRITRLLYERGENRPNGLSHAK